MKKVMMMGRIAKDVETKYTTNGKAFTKVTLAVDAYNGKEKETQFFDVSAWNKLAETIGNYCHKGDQIFVEGELDKRSYEKDGKKMWVTNIVATHLEFGAKGKSNQQSFGKEVAPDSDIPF